MKKVLDVVNVSPISELGKKGVRFRDHVDWSISFKES